MASGKMAAVVVTWHDAHTAAEFQDEDEIAAEHKPRVVQSVGWLFRQDEAGVTIAACYDDEGKYDRHLFVPAGMIVSVKKIGRREPLPVPHPSSAE